MVNLARCWQFESIKWKKRVIKKSAEINRGFLFTFKFLSRHGDFEITSGAEGYLVLREVKGDGVVWVY